MREGWTALDIMVLVSLGVGAGFGLLRGFVVEVFSLVAWVAAIAAVHVFEAPVATALVHPVGTEGGASLLAIVVVFGGVFLSVRFFGRGLGRTARASLFGPVDRVLGFGFGALKGLVGATLAFLAVSLIFDAINGASAPRPKWMTNSHSYDLLRASSAALVSTVDVARRR